MNGRNAIHCLQKELDSTFRNTPGHDALKLAIFAVQGMGEADRNSKIVDKLTDAYIAKLKRHHHVMQLGNMVDIATAREMVFILGDCLDKTKEEIERDLEI